MALKRLENHRNFNIWNSQLQSNFIEIIDWIYNMAGNKFILFCFTLLVTPVVVADTTNKSSYYAPLNYASVLKKGYAPKFSKNENGITTNRGRYLISDSPSISSANYLSIGATYNAATGYAAQSGKIPTVSTYGNYFSKLIQVVANSTDTSGYYRLDSHLHSNYSVDADELDGYKLKFRNNLGKASSTYGYVVFSYDAVSHYLKAEKRYSYNLNPISVTDSNGKPAGKTYYPTYTEDNSFAAKGAGYYVNYSKGEYKLVPSMASATKLYFYTPSDDYGIPNKMNPTNLAYSSNPAVPFSSRVSVDSIESGNTAFYNSINSTYKPQVATPGNDTKTKLSADQFLATIPTTLSVQGAKLRYSTALYSAFRDAALAGRLASAAPADGTPGQKLVPFVYFTNEHDDMGNYHPFMNVVTYTIPGSPQGLLDIPGPPFLGQGSATTPVTRYSNLGYSVVRVPMKDYGQVSKVTDNAMIPSSQSWNMNLVTDSHCGEVNSPILKCPAYDNYNYASISDIGVLIDGSIIFPALNNALMPSQWKGELSTYGCHVGQGGDGPHCHADGFKTGQSIVTLYNDSDYVNKPHPPLIGFGYDGVALFGVYRTDKDKAMLGYSESLDAFGGHDHDNLGYHYHAHTAILPDSYDLNDRGFVISAKNTPVNVLLKGAWAGNINSVPYFGYKSELATNKYLGGMGK